MADFFSTGVSGLLAFQRALDTTSHNIANVGTDGYSRQRVELITRQAQPQGNGWVGKGVEVGTTRRMYDDYVGVQTRTSASGLESLKTYSSHAESLNNLFGDTETGLSASLQKFINAFQGVANSPASTPARQVLLSEANSLAQRLQSFEGRLDEIDQSINHRIGSEIVEINAIAESLGQLNSEIAAGIARTGGQPPNDLLDQRDRLLGQLSAKVNVNISVQDSGTVNVFIGNGQPLLVGSVATQLTAARDGFDSSKVGVAIKTINGTVDVTASITGGSIGGALDFRREMLDSAHNTLGRLSVGLTEVVNGQHRAGIDLSGQLGGDLFSIGDVEVLPRFANSGTATVGVTRADISALTESDYILENTASGWSMRQANGGANVALSGTGTVADPFRADGLSIVVGGVPATGDRFLIRPTRTAVEDMQVLISEPGRIAAAMPIRTAAVAGNTGSGEITGGEVIDASNPQLRSGVTIEFLTPNTYSINGAGSFAYAAGGNIEVNGWRVQISGTPAVGDEFTVSNNSNGSGDNRNALLLANALKQPMLDGGTESLGASMDSFVAGIGVATRQAQLGRDAQELVHQDNLATRDNISGVNLDEEAANMLRYQQAYQAAAQLIRVADTMFQALLDSTRR